MLSIYGKMKRQRYKILDEFRSLKTPGLFVCTDVMGSCIDIIDIADLDWVLQFDSSSNAAAIVHRCGRSAHIGNRGTTLVFLLPNESTYVPFIDINQKVVLTTTVLVSNDSRQSRLWVGRVLLKAIVP